MTRLEMVRAALNALGNDPANEQICRFVLERFGEVIPPKFVPIYRATLRGAEQLRQARESAARMTDEVKKRQAG